jgi:hypothetical protein
MKTRKIVRFGARNRYGVKRYGLRREAIDGPIVGEGHAMPCPSPSVQQSAFSKRRGLASVLG